MPTFEQTLARIDAFAARHMARYATPGMALAITDAERTLALRCYGVADLASGAPLAPEHLLEIGSIGKLFTAIGLMQELDAGRLELHRPMAEALPWFELPSEYEPVTPHHLLRHRAGIPAGPDDTPEARFQVLALREMAAAGPPGERFHYSNLGYKALGLLLEHLAGAPYPQVIAERILRPLGMAATDASITADTRPRMAAGHQPIYDDRPWRPDIPLAPAPFVPTATGDGCLASTPEDMAIFARMLLGGGAFPGGRLLSERAFGLLVGEGYREGDEMEYCYALNAGLEDGRRQLWHSGGMPGYVAHLRCDLDDGLGVVVLMNGPGAPMAGSRFILSCLHAWRANAPLPELPTHDRNRVERAAEYAGVFTRAAGASGPERLILHADGERLLLEIDGGRAALAPDGEDAFIVPALDRYRLTFARAADGRVAEAFYGDSWYIGAAYDGPAHFEHPPEWDAFVGRYRSHNPWVPFAEALLRKGRLMLLAGGYEGAAGDDEPLVPLPDGSFRVGDDPHGPERVRFDTELEGKVLRLILSGAAMYRER